MVTINEADPAQQWYFESMRFKPDADCKIKAFCDALGFQPDVVEYFVFSCISRQVIKNIASRDDHEYLSVVEVKHIIREKAI